MELIEVIKEPYFNKKSASLSTNKFVLTFLVDKRANKVMIKKAFHSFFGVKALAVNTLIKHPKKAKITLKSRKNFTKAKKIAYVSLLREDFLALRRALEGDTDVAETMAKELEAIQSEKVKVVEGQETAEPASLEVKEEKTEESVKEAKPKRKTKPRVKKDSEDAVIKADTVEELAEEQSKEDSQEPQE